MDPFIEPFAASGFPDADARTRAALAAEVERAFRARAGREPRWRVWVPGRVELFGKHGSRTWVKMGEFPIDRELITD